MVVIAPATLSDLPLLTELETDLFVNERISRRQFRYLLTKANSIVIKAENSGTLLGYLVLLNRVTSSNLRIYSIGVAGSVRNQGIARSLLQYAEQVARSQHKSQLTLEVCENNHPAIKLYYDIGYCLYGRKTNYYEDGCTALLLRKHTTLTEIDK